MEVERRQFFKICGTGAIGASAMALGLSPTPGEAASSRQYKLLRAKETRNNCPYCSVGCGILMYGLGDGARNALSDIYHIEGDPDHPVSRGSLCPKGAGLIDFVHSKQRLRQPEYRAPGSDKWVPIGWEEALDRIARLMKDDRDHNFVERLPNGRLVNRWLTTGMLCSSAASNETGILDQKFCRALGMLGMDSQARICHAPTVSGLGPSFGRGAMTNNWVDIKNANVVIVMGGNPCEAHPVGSKWIIEAKINNGAKIIVVDPRFNRTASIADHYVPIRPGSDIAFLLGVANYLLRTDKLQHAYVAAYTNASFIVREDFGFEEGLFSGFDSENNSYDRSSWSYELDGEGHVRTDPTYQHPRCVLNLLKQHVARYTPEMVSRICGTPEKDFRIVCDALASTSVPDKTATFLYALGWTHHSSGSQIIRCSAIVQLLLGNMGMAGGGVNALRGHSNIQGYTDLGLLSERLPGYLNLPTEAQKTLDAYLSETTPKEIVPDQVNYYRNIPKLFISLMKSFWGEKASRQNDWGFDWLPKWDKTYDILRFIDMMFDGQVNGYIVQGFNPMAAVPDKSKTQRALSKLKYLVIIDPLATETSEFWRNVGEMNDVDSSSIMTEVFRLPASCFAEENGSIVNSGRWLQWHYAGASPPGEARQDAEILGGIFTRIRALYDREGGANPAPVLNMAWDYRRPEAPTPEEVAQENNGYALADIRDESGNVVVRAGELLPSPSLLRDDGTTSSLTWIFCGSWTQAGNQMARRDNSDVSGLGCTPGWAWSWPENRRILYNRASADPAGKPWDPARRLIEWKNGRWDGIDVPDYPRAAAPGSDVGPFIMLPEGVGRLFSVGGLVDGPFPEHYEPTESPLAANPLHAKIKSNPMARVLPNDRKRMGGPDQFPYVATSYGITELFRYWTQHSRLNAILQPEQFVEIGEKLAREKGISPGDVVRVSSKRGYIKAKAVVTKRIFRLDLGGQMIDTIGVPANFGFKGETRKSFLSNTLSPAVGDANSQTPEFKAFLVNIEKV